MSGAAVLAIATVLQVTSLWFAPLIVVQPLGAIGLVFTAFLNARLSGMPLNRRTVLAIILCVGGVGAFVTLAAFFAEEPAVGERELRLVLLLLAVLLFAWLVAFVILRRRRNPVFYVIAAGTLYGFVATLAKTVMAASRPSSRRKWEFGDAEWLTIVCNHRARGGRDRRHVLRPDGPRVRPAGPRRRRPHRRRPDRRGPHRHARPRRARLGTGVDRRDDERLRGGRGLRRVPARAGTTRRCRATRRSCRSCVGRVAVRDRSD